MEKVRCTAVIHKKSEEAKHFDFSSGDSSMLGNVIFIWDELRCPACGVMVSGNEMMKIDRTNRQEGISTKKHFSRINPMYIRFQKHACPKCGVRLEVDYESMKLRPQSTTAEDGMFSLSQTRFVRSV